MRCRCSRSGLSPLHMVTLFEALEQERQKKATKAKDGEDAKDENADDEDSPSWLGIAFASHPSDADRIAYFRAAAQ